MLNPEIQHDFEQILNKLNPKTLLIIGASVTELFPTYPQTQTDTHITTIALPAQVMPAIEGKDPYDLAILIEPLNKTSKQEAGQILSALRDIYSHYLLLLISITDSCPWQHSDLIAYGLNELRRYNNKCYLFEYNIMTYKRTPDWLNSQYWANPDLWNKYRW